MTKDSSAHAIQKFNVCFGFFELVQNKLGRFDFIHFMGEFAENPDFLHGGWIQKKLFATRAASIDIHCGVDAPLHKFSFKVDFHVSCSFELLVNDFIHPAAGFYQRGGDDGEAAALFQVPGCAEKSLWARQGVGFDAA